MMSTRLANKSWSRLIPFRRSEFFERGITVYWTEVWCTFCSGQSLKEGDLVADNWSAYNLAAGKSYHIHIRYVKVMICLVCKQMLFLPDFTPLIHLHCLQQFFSSPGLKGHESFSHHFASVVVVGVTFLHFHQLLWNCWANFNQTLVEGFYDSPL